MPAEHRQTEITAPIHERIIATAKQRESLHIFSHPQLTKYSNAEDRLSKDIEPRTRALLLSGIPAHDESVTSLFKLADILIAEARLGQYQGYPAYEGTYDGLRAYARMLVEAGQTEQARAILDEIPNQAYKHFAELEASEGIFMYDDPISPQEEQFILHVAENVLGGEYANFASSILLNLLLSEYQSTPAIPKAELAFRALQLMNKSKQEGKTFFEDQARIAMATELLAKDPTVWIEDQERLVPLVGSYLFNDAHYYDSATNPDAAMIRQTPGSSILSVASVDIFTSIYKNLQHAFPPTGDTQLDDKKLAALDKKVKILIHAMAYVDSSLLPLLRLDHAYVIKALLAKPNPFNNVRAIGIEQVATSSLEFSLPGTHDIITSLPGYNALALSDEEIVNLSPAQRADLQLRAQNDEELASSLIQLGIE